MIQTGGLSTDYMQELTYQDRKRVHNLKYFTWIEQQGRELDELNAQWYDESYWTELRQEVHEIDNRIRDFNAKVAAVN